MGDAVMQIWVSEQLFRHEPVLSEGQMSRYRAAIVCEKSFASLMRQMKLGQFIRLGRGLIINIHFVYRIDIATQQLVLSDCNGCYHELSASREVLIKLKAYMETLMKLGNE